MAAVGQGLRATLGLAGRDGARAKPSPQLPEQAEFKYIFGPIADPLVGLTVGSVGYAMSSKSEIASAFRDCDLRQLLDVLKTKALLVKKGIRGERE